MTKHRLMLSAATAALLAAPLSGARAATEVSSNQGAAVNTTTTGDLTIDAGGGVSIKAAGPAVTLNSNNFVVNSGTVANTGTTGAVGFMIDTSGGNLIVPTTGLTNIGALDLSGNGTSKAAIYVTGGNTYAGLINFAATVATPGATTASGGSGINVVGDTSNIFALSQGTTIDGNVFLGGAMTLTQSNKSQALGGTAIDSEGTINGDFQLPRLTTLTVTGNQYRGVAILGPIAACVTGGGTGCTDTGAGLNTGNFTNSGTITVVGVANPNTKGGNVEGGSVLVIGNSIAGGFLNNGPSTATGSTISASLIGNGDVSSTVFSPTVLIDPSQSITASQLTARGPVIIGPIASSIDSVDPGYSIINRGTIRGQPTDTDINSVAMAIQGSSATNFTYLSSASAAGNPAGTGATPLALNPAKVGFLNTGAILAQSFTKENTTSSTSANALFIGSYTTVPRLVVSGETISGSTYTSGTINAAVTGQGGGTAVAVLINGTSAIVPQIDVLAHGFITANINTSTLSPDLNSASAARRFSQIAIAIEDLSGSVKFINNAGTIAGLTTTQTPASNAAQFVDNISQAINLQGGTTGGTKINNSGIIEGDVLFNSGGGNNIFNIGNTGGTAASPTANGDIATLNGAPVTNTPFAYASVSGKVDFTLSGLAPTTEINTIDFGSGNGNILHVGGFGYVDSVINSAAGGLDVQVDNGGQLFVANFATSLNADTFNVSNGGVLGLTISQQQISGGIPVVKAATSATLGADASLGLQFGSFVSSGTTTASVNNPTVQTITLLSAPTVVDSGIAAQNTALAKQIPFLFESPSEAGSVAPLPLSQPNPQTLLLKLLPRVPGAKNADGTAGLGLSGDALALYPNIVNALANDPKLGAAIANNLNIYNSPTIGASSGLNIAASQQKAQQVFSQFTPDVSGGTRQVAILITDQETGPVAARQRLLRNYANQDGELTLWSEEFIGNINNKGRVDADGSLTAYKDHGFGFVLGMDAGSAHGGWYGGALTYYSGDVTESLPRSSKTNEQWYMLTGYTDWRGRHTFIDTTASVAYGDLRGNRTIAIGDQSRDALGKRAGLLAALGATGGVNLNYGLLQMMPHIGLDGLISREEGYTENGGGDGFDLQVAPYYANSFRVSLGSDFKSSFDVFGATLSPEARLGYRYDLVSTPVKLRAGFVSTGGLTSPGNSFTFVGPDPDTGNFVGGLSLGAGTDTWQFGFNYDWVRGNHGSTTQVGTITLLGRI